uniref:Uncharacterized protein n=1 Tax=Romanomermis culicivorax TaxID=13658 RepID=A0A915HPP1_ROMCU
MDNAETNSVDDSMGANNGNLNGNSGDNSVGYGQLSDDLLMETIQDIIKQQDGTGNAKKHLQQQNSFDGNQKIKTSNRPIKIQIDGDGQQVKARKQNVIVQKRTDGGEEVNYYYYDQTIPKQKIKISLGDSSSKSSYQNGMEYELDLGQNGKNVKRKNQNEPQNVNIYETTSDQNVGTGFHFKKIYLGGPMEDNVEISTSETVVISEGMGQQKTMTKKKKKKKLITIELESSDEEDDEDDLAALQRYRNMKIKEKNNLYGIKKTGGRKVEQEFDNEDQTSTQSQSTNTEDQYTDSQITEKVKRKKVKSSTNDYKDEMDRRKIEMELNGNDKEYYPSMDRTSQMLEAETKKVNKQGSIDQSYMETDYYYDSKTKKKSKVKSSKSTAQSVQWYKLTQTSRKPESATAAYQSTMTMGMSTNYKAKQQDVDEYYYTEVDTEFEKKKKIKVKKSRTRFC